MTYSLNEKYEILFILILSIVAFYFYQGFAILDIHNDGWLFMRDYYQNYSSVSLYRYSDFQFPIGDINNADLPVKANIIFSDGNLLLALINKAFSFILPDNIQLYGIWLLSCFILQFLASWWLLKQFGVNGIYMILGTVLISLYPAFLYRVGHLNLMPHFLLLFSMGIYFSKQKLKIKLILLYILIIFSLLIHVYFVPLIFSIFLLIFIEKCLSGNISLVYLLKHLFILSIFLAFMMFILGYFSDFDSKAFGFGYFSMNLNAPVNSMGKSLFLKGMPLGEVGQAEGYQYFGFGAIILFVSLFFIKNALTNFKSLFTSSLIVLILSWLFIALSNKWYLGSFLFFKINLPDQLYNILSTFRASGRYFWFIGYLLFTFVLVGIYRSAKDKNSLKIIELFLLFIVVVQVLDLYRYFNKELSSCKTPQEIIDYKELSHTLKDRNLYNTPIYVDGTEDTRRKIITALVSTDGKEIISIGPWLHVRKSKRFEKNKDFNNYLDYVRSQNGLLISKSSHSYDKSLKLLYGKDEIFVYRLGKEIDLSYNASMLPSQTGNIEGTNRVAKSGVNKSNYITYGPYIRLPEGKYKLNTIYVSPESNNTIIGHWDIAVQSHSKIDIIDKGIILGTNGNESNITSAFIMPKQYYDKKIEIRNYYNGVGNLTIKSLSIMKIE